MGRSVLTIDTLEPDRDFIVINKQSFYLRENAELSLLQMAKVRKLGRAVVDKGFDLDATEEDIQRIEEFANEALEIIVVDLPNEIRDKLTTLWKFRIVQAFTDVASSKRAGTATEETEKGSLPTTGGSSPGSDASTGAAL
jgi:hypothetical protein